MHRTILERGRNQRGYSLVEVLVAVAIFAVIILGALMLYDRSNQVFKQSVEASDMQQSTRVAFDKLAADLRMAGFDYDRDGTPFSALATTWKPETTYTSGMLVQPTNPNGHTYICINGGMSGKSEPVWPTGSKQQVTEGATLTWQETGSLQYQQPDEQIEYAGRSAVAIRANFNYETATGPCTALAPCENGREPALQSAEFPVVTTANNEIVIYALRPVKWASGETADTLSFYADTSKPRKVSPVTDAKENLVEITGVDLCDNGCNSPPYTLYRYTLDENGKPDGGVPVAENIREVRYRYFTTTSAAAADEITTLPKGDGQYDGAKPDETVAGRDTRASIRAVELSLTGMNPQPDYAYTDASDPVARNYRKLELRSLITPRNIGRRGMKEYSTDPPGEPEIKSICSGACNAVFLTWAAPATGGDVESYAVLYDSDPCGAGGTMPSGGFQYSEEVGLNLYGSVGRFTEPGKTYSFAVQAISKWGAQSSKCVGPVTVINKTKPAALPQLIATHKTPVAPQYAALKNQIDLYFPPALNNVSGQGQLSCNTGGVLTQEEMPPAEKRYYEIYRGKSIAFQPGDSGSALVLDAGTAQQPVSAGDLMKWSDTRAANCTDYYYRIRVVDYCARKDTWNDPNSTAQGTSEWYPALNQNAIAGWAENYAAKPQKPSLTLEKANCAGVSGNCQLTLGWPGVAKNVADEPITVDKYVIRAFKSADGLTFPTTATDVITVTGGALSITYEVKATDLWKFVAHAVDCQESDPSNAVVYPCIFSGGNLTASLVSGVYGGSGSAADPFIVEGPTLQVSTTTAVSEYRVSVIDAVDGTQLAAMSKSGPLASTTFGLPDTPDGRTVRVVVTAVDNAGCTKIADLYMVDQAAPACSLTDAGSDSSIVAVGKSSVVYTLKNANATAPLTIRKIVVRLDKSQGKSLPAVIFNGVNVNTGCTLPNLVVNAPANSVVPANSASYKLELDYQDANLQGVNPTLSLCIVYQVPSGDILRCQIAPGAGTCTEPASSCQ